MALRSPARSWLAVSRLGHDVLRLRNGSLRGVLECASPAARLATALVAAGTVAHPIQLVVQARRPERIRDADPLTLLRASHAELSASTLGRAGQLVDRLLAVVPWDVEEGAGGGDAVLDGRVARVSDLLAGAGLEPVVLQDAALDAVMVWDEPCERPTEVRLGDRLARTLVAGSHPERLDRAWFSALPDEHDLALHLVPAGSNRKEASAYLTLWAGDRRRLDDATRRAEEVLIGHGVTVRRPFLQAEPALVSGLPLGLDLAAPSVRPCLRGGRAIRPAGHTEGAVRPGPLLYGVCPPWQQPLELDRFAQENANLVLLGESGPTRTSSVSYELLRARLAGLEVHVVDPAGAHAAIADAIGGTVVAPSLADHTPFDPFTMVGTGDSLEGRLQVLAALVEVLGAGLPAVLRPLVEDALAFAYAAHGYLNHGDPGDRTPPGLGDLAAILARRAGQAGDTVRAAQVALAERLERYVRGDARRLLGRPAARPAGRPLLSVYSLAGLPEEHRPAAALLSLDQVWSRLAGDRPSLVIVDGADLLLPFELCIRFLSDLMRSAGRRRSGLTLVSSNPAGVLGGPLRDAALQAGVRILLRQTAPDAGLLADAFRLTPAERAWLLDAADGEGLLMAGGDRRAFRAVASREELRLTGRASSGGIR